MTNEQWINLFKEAYNLRFRDDVRLDKWEKRKFTEEEKSFLMSTYSEEFANLYQEHILDIVQIFTRFFFKKAVRGDTFCSLEKVKSEFGKTLEQNYGLSSGPFINLAKTYWTFRLQLDEDQYRQPKDNMPLFFSILRTVEMNIAGVFFPTGGPATKVQQRQILEEFAPEIDIERFLSENPILKWESSRQGSFLKPRFVPITVGFLKLFLAVVIYVVLDNLLGKFLSFLLILWSIVSFKVGFKASDKELEELVNNPDVAPESSNRIFRKYVFDEKEDKHEMKDE